MKFLKLNSVLFGLLVCFLAVSAAGARDRYSANFVWVTVNGVKITNEQANSAIEKDVQFAIKIEKPPTPEMQFNMKLRAIEDLIERLVMNERIKAKKIKVTGDEVKKEVARIAAFNNMTVQEFYNRAYSTQNKTPAEVNDNIAMGLRFDKLIVKEAGPDYFQVSVRVAQRYYARNKKKFIRPAKVRASHIMINYPKGDREGKDKVKYAMGKIIEKANKGMDFAALAKQYSQDSITRKNGGDLGLLSKGYMPQKVEDIAFSLRPGELSGVIEMPYGCHVIKVFEVDKGGLISFDKVKPDIEAWIRDDMKAEFAAKYREQHLSNAKIKWRGGRRPKPMKIPESR